MGIHDQRIGGIRPDKPPLPPIKGGLGNLTTEQFADLMRLNNEMNRLRTQRQELRTLLNRILWKAKQKGGRIPAKMRREVEAYLMRTGEPSDILRDQE